MSGYQVQAYSDDEAIVTPLSEEGEPTGGGWIGCCGWVCLLGGIPICYIVTGKQIGRAHV